MLEPAEPVVQTSNEGTAGKWILLAVALLFVAGSSYFLYTLNTHLYVLELQNRRLAKAKSRNSPSAFKTPRLMTKTREPSK